MKGMHWIRGLCVVACLALSAVATANEDPALPAVVNINSADAQTLAERLDGVGVVRAEAIVRYRELNGDFATIEELANVTGIGMSTVDRNEARIALADD